VSSREARAESVWYIIIRSGMPPTALSPGFHLVSPCRDETRYLRRTLDSVAAQSVPPALWVVVDDGSTDETPAILRSALILAVAARLPMPPRGYPAVIGSVAMRTISPTAIRITHEPRQHSAPTS